MTLTEAREKALRHEERRGWPRCYPTTPMVDEAFSLSEDAREALTRFRDARPFRLAPDAYLAAVDRLYAGLAAAYALPAPAVDHDGDWTGDSGSSSYTPASHRVTLRGRASVITALHEWMHARGYGETAAVWWSVNAFRLIWPRAFAKLVTVRGTHVLRRRAA